MSDPPALAMLALLVDSPGREEGGRGGIGGHLRFIF